MVYTESSPQPEISPTIGVDMDREIPERLVVFYHPRDTREVKRLQQAEKTHRLNVEPHETSPHLQENIDSLIEADLTDNSILMVSGGDGTASKILGAALTLGIESPALISPRGHINDLAHMIYKDSRNFKQPERLAKTGFLRELHPLQIKVKPAEGQQTDEYAFGYATFGISGLAAARMNSPNYRKSLIYKNPAGAYAKEHFAVFQSFMQSKSFTLDSNKNAELLIANGSQMARYLKVANNNLFKKEARVIEVATKLDGITSGLALLANQPIGRPLEDVLEFVAEGSPLYMQLDGEHSAHDGQTVFSISIAESHMSMLTDRTVEL